MGISIFSAGAGCVYVLLNSNPDDGTGGLVTKGFFIPVAVFVAVLGGWMVVMALKAQTKTG